MLRKQGLTDKLLMLGIDGMDPVLPSGWLRKGKCRTPKK